jgi:hypothetical protein
VVGAALGTTSRFRYRGSSGGELAATEPKPTNRSRCTSMAPASHPNQQISILPMDASAVLNRANKRMTALVALYARPESFRGEQCAHASDGEK